MRSETESAVQPSSAASIPTHPIPLVDSPWAISFVKLLGSHFDRFPEHCRC